MEPDTNIVGSIDPLTTDTDNDNDITILDVLILLARRKKTIVYLTIGATLLAVIVSVLLPNIYTGTTRLLPPQQPKSAAAEIIAYLNPMPAVLGGGQLGLTNPADLNVVLLRSRFVADELIGRFDLRKVYGSKTDLDVHNQLAGATKVKATKEGVVEISVDDRDPKRAADMANGYVDALRKLMQTLAFSEASQRRQFYERQLVTAKENLIGAEIALKETQEKTGLIQLDGQQKAIIEAVAVLKAKIATKEIQLQRMRLFATEQNPDLQGAEQELSTLRAQLATLEQKSVGGKGDILLATSKVPEAGLEYIRRLRNVKYSETIFELLAKQLEAAKLDEANSSAIQVIDKAVVPERKSGPKRLRIVVLSGFLAFLFSTVWVLIGEYFQHQQRNPERAARLHLFRTYLLGEDNLRS